MCRSSSAATAATSRTCTASATSTRSPACSRSTSATRSARRSGRRRSPRCASCPSTRTGRTRTRARSSWHRRWRRWRRATSTACSSCRAARRRSSRRGSSRGSSTPRAATVAEPPHDELVAAARVQRTRRSPGTSRTTDDVRRTLDQRHPRHPRAVRAACARGAARLQHEPLPPPARGDGRGVHRVPPRRARAHDPRHGPRDRLSRAHGAGAERGRDVRCAGGLLARRARRSARSTTSCSPPTR